MKEYILLSKWSSSKTATQITEGISISVNINQL